MRNKVCQCIQKLSQGLPYSVVGIVRRSITAKGKGILKAGFVGLKNRKGRVDAWTWRGGLDFLSDGWMPCAYVLEHSA